MYAIRSYYAKTLLTGWVPEIWLFALGAIFIFVTLFLPRGVLGGLSAFGDLIGAKAKSNSQAKGPSSTAPQLAE